MNNSIYAISIPLILSLMSKGIGSANQAEIIQIISNESIVNQYKNMVAENILKAYNSDSSIIKNKVYDNVVGYGFHAGDHKKKLFNYNKKIRPFNLAWRDIPLLNKDQTWRQLFTENFNQKGKYDYKMYISIIHDLNPEKESMRDIIKAIALIGKKLIGYKEKYPNNYLSAKTAGSARTFWEHYDNFVVYTDNPKIIEEICRDFNSGIRQNINRKLEHAYILSPEERKNLFMRGTLGIDVNAPNKDDVQTDSLILAQFIIQFLDFMKQKGITPTKDSIIKIMNTWADLPFQKDKLR